jgi:uncharacterized membrane protein
LNLRDPASMNEVISKVLRYGVLVSGSVITIGTILLLASSGVSGVAGDLTYFPNQIPHGTFDISFAAMAGGIVELKPFSIIELGVLLLLATPVSRVAISVLLFAAEKDRLYVAVTAVVLCFLLFSIIFVPFIPGFHA